MVTAPVTTTTTTMTSTPGWLSNLLAPLIAIGKAILNALANFNWSSIFPNFGSLATSLVALLQTLLGLAETKLAAAPAAA